MSSDTQSTNNDHVIAFTPTQLLLIAALVFIVLYLRRNQNALPESANQS